MIRHSDRGLTHLQVPWALAYSTWYHQYVAYPIQALTAAILLQEYTLTDRGTILSLDPKIAENTVIYKAAEDNEKDPLLNPAHLLIGSKALDKKVAQAFADWATSKKGQKVITDFKKNGEQLYSGAPSKTIEGYETDQAQREAERKVISHKTEEWTTIVKSEPASTPEAQGSYVDL